MKLKLLPKLIISLAVLGGLLTVFISIFSFRNSKSSLEDLYADRVVMGCKTVASMLSLDDVKEILAENGDSTEAYARTYDLFNKIKKDGSITFLSLVVPDEDSVKFYIDSLVPEMGDDPANQLPYGTDCLYVDVVSDEADMANYQLIWDQYSQNKGVEVPVITDNDYGYNYTGVAPVLDENGVAIAEVQYILDMNGVREYLNSFLTKMFVISFIIVALAILGYIVFVRFAVTRPVGQLASFTNEVTNSKNFSDHRISIRTGDEIEELGNSFNFMLDALVDYIHDLNAVTAEKERIGAELNVATQIQASMLPSTFPAFPDHDEFDIFATMTPAKEVGGDFYDFFMLDKTHVAIVVADVSGKGVPAALFMVIAKTLIKDHSFPFDDLGKVFSTVNELLCASNSGGLFVTAFEGVLDLVTGEFKYVNAGHEMPFIYKAANSYSAQKVRPGFVLAGMEGMCYRGGVFQLEPGDKIFQYTDGVTEATDANNQLYGMDRLTEVLNANSDKGCYELLPAVKADIDAFVGDAPQFDDITMLCLEYKKRAVVDEDIPADS